MYDNVKSEMEMISQKSGIILEKNHAKSRLKDSEIERILACRKMLRNKPEDISLTDIYQLLYENGFKVMNPNVKFEELDIVQKEKRNKILEVYKIRGNIAYNHEALTCPVCDHRYIAHNTYDTDYPFVDKEMIDEGIEPLTFQSKYSEYKYYCLNCGSRYGRKEDAKEIFSFERGAYFAGSLAYTIWEMRDCMLFESRAYNDFHNMKDYHFRMPKSAIGKLMHAVEKASSWEADYQNPDNIMDGYGWHIRFHYSGISIITEGYVAYPPDFSKVVKRIQKEIEELCKEYARNYSADGLKKRLSL